MGNGWWQSQKMTRNVDSFRAFCCVYESAQRPKSAGSSQLRNFSVDYVDSVIFCMCRNSNDLEIIRKLKKNSRTFSVALATSAAEEVLEHLSKISITYRIIFRDIFTFIIVTFLPSHYSY